MDVHLSISFVLKDVVLAFWVIHEMIQKNYLNSQVNENSCTLAHRSRYKLLTSQAGHFLKHVMVKLKHHIWPPASVLAACLWPALALCGVRTVAPRSGALGSWRLPLPTRSLRSASAGVQLARATACALLPDPGGHVAKRAPRGGSASARGRGVLVSIRDRRGGGRRSVPGAPADRVSTVAYR
jgi:hypothetical protein